MYAIYLRKSRADRDMPDMSNEEILARHEKTLTELAASRNYNIGKIYREVVSGETIAARPEMQKLLSDVSSGIYKGVLVMEIERLARGSGIDQGIVSQTFMYSGTLIITPSKTYDPANEFDEEFFEFGLFMSRREYKTINRRLQAGRAASHREGKYTGSVAPYGYNRVKIIGEKGWSLEPNENADTVRIIFSLYTDSLYGCRKICKVLDDMGIKSAKGGCWTPSVIRGILTNEVYTGKIAHNKSITQKRMENGTVVIKRPRQTDYQLFDGIHPAIITSEMWNRTQEILRRNIKAPSSGETKNPLAGILICGKCGSKMQRRPHSSAQPKDYIICKCGNVGSPLIDIEDAVIDALKLWYNDLPMPRMQPHNDNTIMLKTAHTRLKKYQNQLENIFSLVEQGIYDNAVFTKRYTEINNKISALNKQIDIMKADNKCKGSISNTFPENAPFPEIFSDMPPKQKNLILKELFYKIIYNKPERGKNFTLEFCARFICDKSV